MALEFRCPSCNRILRTPDESAGKKARCPQCGTIVDIPTSTDPFATLSQPGQPQGGSPPPGPALGAPLPSVPVSNLAAPSAAPAGAAGDSPFGRPSGGYESAAANPFGESSGGTPFGSPAAAKGATSDNPYAAPSYGAETPDMQAGSTGPSPLVPCKLSMDVLLRTSWDTFVRQFGMALVLGLVAFGVNFGVGMIGNVIAQVGAAANDPVIFGITQLISQIIGFLGQTWIQLGLIVTTLRWARTEQIQVGDLFSVGYVYGRGLVLMLLLSVAIYGTFFVFEIPALATLAVGVDPVVTVIAAIVGGLLAVPVVIWIGLRFYLSLYILVDRQQGIIAAMKESSRYMEGNKLTVLLVAIVIGVGSFFAIIFTCCLGLVAVIPFGALIGTYGYLMMTGQPYYRPPVVAAKPTDNAGYPPNPQDPMGSPSPPAST